MFVKQPRTSLEILSCTLGTPHQAQKQSVNNTVHEEFRKLIKSAFKSGLVDPDDLVSNILQQIENDVQELRIGTLWIISNHNRILYGWASLAYLKEHKMHAFNPAATTRMKARTTLIQF